MPGGPRAWPVVYRQAPYVPLRRKHEKRLAAQEKDYAEPNKHRNEKFSHYQTYNVVKLFYVMLHTGAQLQSIDQYKNVRLPFAWDTKSTTCGVALVRLPMYLDRAGHS